MPDDRPLTRDVAVWYLDVRPLVSYKWAVEQGCVAYSRLGDEAKAPLRFEKKDLDDFIRASRIPTIEETRAHLS